MCTHVTLSHTSIAVLQFEPRSGPLEGGTLLTIRGAYFASPSDENVKRSVKLIRNEQCDIVAVNSNDTYVLRPVDTRVHHST